MTQTAGSADQYDAVLEMDGDGEWACAECVASLRRTSVTAPICGASRSWAMQTPDLTHGKAITSGVKILSFQYAPIASSACETTPAESTSVNGKFPS
jgi:hypothetical protein